MSKKVINKDWRIRLFTLREQNTPQGRMPVKTYLPDTDGSPKLFCAHYRKLKGTETVSADARIVDCEVTYVVNYRPDITEELYIEDVVTGKLYDIKYVDDYEGRHTDLTLYASSYYGIKEAPRYAVQH